VSKSKLPRLKIASEFDEIGNHVWNEILCFTSYGVRVGIRVNRKGILDRILPYLPPGWKESRASNLDRLYSFVIRDETQQAKRRRVHLVYADGSEVAKTPKLDQAIDAFESSLQLFVAETAPRRVFVHAGVVSVRGRAIVIPGRSFSGKTSLVAALVKAGAVYYSDEYAVLDESGRVHHYARPLSIRDSGHLRKPKKYQVEALGGRSGAKPLKVGMVVVSKYRAGARWHPRTLSEGEGALELMANTVSARRRPAAMLEAIRKVVSVAPVVKGNRGEAGQVVQFILTALSNGR
jgi:hypothetical protein